MLGGARDHTQLQYVYNYAGLDAPFSLCTSNIIALFGVVIIMY